MRPILITLLTSLLITSCKKDKGPANITGTWKWTVQYTDNPNNNITPLNTGINETLQFKNDGSYSVDRNNIIVNTGTYQTFTTAYKYDGHEVSRVLFKNVRTTDSNAYYILFDKKLVFSDTFIGSITSGSRHYQKL